MAKFTQSFGDDSYSIHVSGRDQKPGSASHPELKLLLKFLVCSDLIVPRIPRVGKRGNSGRSISEKSLQLCPFRSYLVKGCEIPGLYGRGVHVESGVSDASHPRKLSIPPPGLEQSRQKWDTLFQYTSPAPLRDP